MFGFVPRSRRWLLTLPVIVVLLSTAALSTRQSTLPPRSAEANPAANPYLDQPGQPPVPTPLAPGTHPRLFFSSDQIPALRSRASGSHIAIWQRIQSVANSELRTPRLQMPAEGDQDAFRDAGNRLVVVAFAYVVTGNQEFGDLARQRLLAYSTWQYWGDLAGYGQRRLGFHHMIFGVALAYDWMYNSLSESDRQEIRGALARHTQESFEASGSPRSVEAWGNWWRRAYTQNHHWVNTAALGMAALALDGEDARSSQWLGLATEQFQRDKALAEGIGDGTWHEGLPYQTYALATALPFLYNLNRLRGTDILPDRYLQAYGLWRIYNSLPDTTRFVFTYGDLQSSWTDAFWPPSVLRFIASRLQDGRSQWMADEFELNATARSSTSAAPWSVFEFFFYDPGVPALPPADLPTSRAFPDLEGVIWRAGWGKDDLTFALKTGAYAGRFAFDTFTSSPPRFPWDHPDSDMMNDGHDHDDTNTFYIYRGNVCLSSETAGVDAFATSYHNTVLVDGKGQYRDPDYGPGYNYWDMNRDPFVGSDGHLDLAAGSPNFDYLVADATNRYRLPDSLGRPGDRLVDEFRRYVLFARPGYFVMVDNIRSQNTHQYDWTVHFATSVEAEGDWLKGTAANSQVLGVKVLSPDPFVITTGSDGNPYARVRPSISTTDTRFVTVLFPTDLASWDNRPAMEILGNSDQAAGVRVLLDGTQDHLIKYGNQDLVAVATYEFDGKAASVIQDSNGALRRTFLGQGSKLLSEKGARVLIEVPRKTAAVEASYPGTALSIWGDNLEGSGARFYGPSVALSQVTLNGKPATATRSGDYVVLD